MFDRLVRDVMDADAALFITSATTVTVAAERMADTGSGAIMVVDGERLVGIFTERDALFRVIARGRDPRTTRLSEVMTPQPRTVSPDDTYGYALLMMQEAGFRHAPVLSAGKPIGLVSSRPAMDPELEEFTSEAARRAHIRSAH